MLQERPWVALYPENVPADIEIPQITAIEQFRKTVKRVPNKPAVYYFEQKISYREIDELSNELAAIFEEMGLVKGDRVALFMQNIPQFWIAELAAWKIGAIAVPINVMYKGEELLYHLNDSEAKVLVVMESFYEAVAKDIIAQTSIEHVITTSELDFLNNDYPVPEILRDVQKFSNLADTDFLNYCEKHRGAIDPDVSLDIEDTALLVYTSGTTGPPKGAMITHKNIAFNATFMSLWTGADENDVNVTMAPLFHITGLITNLAYSALTGVPTVLTYRFDAGEMLKQIEQWKGTSSVGASTAYTAMINHPDIHKRDISSFTRAYTGGAPLTQSTVEQFNKITNNSIHNGYGLTETTSPSHSVPFGRRMPVDDESGVLSVGIPVSNTQCKIVDIKTKEELPVGEVGEIVVKGPQVFKGYWRKEEETKNALRDGWLYTGDVGRVDEQGWCYVIERIKDMIIASGFKVWPAEVEGVLFKHDKVREAAVIGVEDEYRGQTVKAFVSLKDGVEPTDALKEDIMEFCKERLANYKYPRQVEFVDEVPKNATGKFLRRLLRDDD